MDALRAKGDLLTGYLEFVILEVAKATNVGLKIISPKDVASRGSQISMVLPKDGKKVFDRLTESGVIADWREPDVIRLAPVPLYNSFMDVFYFGEILKSAL